MDDPPPRSLDELWAQLTDPERKAVGEDLSEHEGVGVEARLAKLIRRHHKRGTDTGPPRPAINLPPAQLRSATPANPGQQSIDTLWAELSEHERLAVSEDLEEHGGAGVEARFGKLVRRHHLRAVNLGVVRGRSQELSIQSEMAHSVAAVPEVPPSSKMAKTEQGKDDDHASVVRLPRADHCTESETNRTGGQQQSGTHQTTGKDEQSAALVSGNSADTGSASDQGILISKQGTFPTPRAHWKESTTLGSDTIASGINEASNSSQHSMPPLPQNANEDNQTVSIGNKEGRSGSQATSCPAGGSSDTGTVGGLTNQTKNANFTRLEDIASSEDPPKWTVGGFVVGSSNTKSGKAQPRNPTISPQPAAATHSPAFVPDGSIQPATLRQNDVSTHSPRFLKRMSDLANDLPWKRSRMEPVASSEPRTLNALSEFPTSKAEDGPDLVTKPNSNIGPNNTASKSEPHVSGSQKPLAIGCTTSSGQGNAAVQETSVTPLMSQAITPRQDTATGTSSPFSHSSLTPHSFGVPNFAKGGPAETPATRIMRSNPTSLFGQPSTSNVPTSGGLKGSSQNSPASLFGELSANIALTFGSLRGPSQTNPTSLFGKPPTDIVPTFGGLKGPSQTNPASLFGEPSAKIAPTFSGLRGSTQANPFCIEGLGGPKSGTFRSSFGSQVEQASPAAATVKSPFLSKDNPLYDPGIPPDSTRDFFQPHWEKSNPQGPCTWDCFHNIGFSQKFRKFSNEELRLADYARGQRFGSFPRPSPKGPPQIKETNAIDKKAKESTIKTTRDPVNTPASARTPAAHPPISTSTSAAPPPVQASLSASRPAVTATSSPSPARQSTIPLDLPQESRLLERRACLSCGSAVEVGIRGGFPVVISPERQGVCPRSHRGMWNHCAEKLLYMIELLTCIQVV